MQITFVQVFEDQAKARTAMGNMTAGGYKVYYVESDQAQLKGYPATGEPKSLVVGDIDEKKVFLVLSTKDQVETSNVAGGGGA